MSQLIPHITYCDEMKQLQWKQKKRAKQVFHFKSKTLWTFCNMNTQACTNTKTLQTQLLLLFQYSVLLPIIMDPWNCKAMPFQTSAISQTVRPNTLNKPFKTANVLLGAAHSTICPLTIHQVQLQRKNRNSPERLQLENSKNIINHKKEGRKMLSLLNLWGNIPVSHYWALKN